MANRSLNTLLVLFVMVIVAGAGYYQTEVKQPQELESIENAKKLARLKQAEMEQLFVEEATSAELAVETMRKWRARYKHIPAQLSTPEIIEYLQRLSASGFEQFHYKLSSQGQSTNYKYYLFEVSGTAHYESLYRFVWHLENNRDFFYHVNDLDLSHTNVFKTNEETGVKRQLDMVSFSMRLKVFYAGIEGLSAALNDPVEVPEQLLPARQLAHDSFFPIIRTDLPPNDELLVDVEKATLLSIVGERAIFQDKNGQHIVRAGDRVYLGYIIQVDPANMFVRANLDKGGITETVEVNLEIEESQRYRSMPGLRNGGR